MTLSVEPVFRTEPYDGPVVRALVAEIQQEYVRRYGGPDETPVEPAQFSPPHGDFLVMSVDGHVVGCGGWRTAGADGELAVPGRGPVGEIKRMYVVAGARRRGHGRTLLAALERSAATAGMRWMILETGSRQPEAIAMYTAEGYQPVTPFGHYAEAQVSLHLGKPLG